MKRRTPRRRTGAYLVEFAIVLPIVLMLIFGILEFARYLFIRNLVEHAAREGARYAVVHTQDKTPADIKAMVQDELHGAFYQMDSLEVAKVDPATLDFLNAKDEVVATEAQAPFNDAKFGQGIMVRIQGNMTLMMVGMTFPIHSTAVMYSEAN